MIAGTDPDPLPRSVIGRMLAILGSFSPDQPRLTLTQISHLCGLPVTTTYRLLSQAQECGAVIRDADQHYWIGPRIVELAALAPSATTLSGGVAMAGTGISTGTTAAHAGAADRGDRTTPEEPGRR